MVIYDSSGNKIIGVGSNRAEDHYNMGVRNQSEGNLVEAIRNYQQALEISPELVQAQVNLATVYYSQGKITEAIEKYNAALRIDPDMVEAYCNLGNAYCDLGEFDKAIDCYRRFVDRAPSQYGPQIVQVERLIRDLERFT